MFGPPKEPLSLNLNYFSTSELVDSIEPEPRYPINETNCSIKAD